MSTPSPVSSAPGVGFPVSIGISLPVPVLPVSSCSLTNVVKVELDPELVENFPTQVSVADPEMTVVIVSRDSEADVPFEVLEPVAVVGEEEGESFSESVDSGFVESVLFVDPEAPVDSVPLDPGELDDEASLFAAEELEELE